MEVDEASSTPLSLISLALDAPMEGEEETISNFVSTKGWMFDEILARGSNFKPIPRVDVSRKSPHEITELVQQYEHDGIPLVMSNWHRRKGWDASLFDPYWLKKTIGDTDVDLRNVHNRQDVNQMTLGEYLDHALRALPYANPTEKERLYAKDAPCPPAWTDWLQQNLPDYLLPFGSGDMSANLSSENRVETLMTYIGMGDTYTPAHKDSCASVGQNLMVYTQGHDVSSFWFMTATKNAAEASDYWRTLGYELDLESYVASIDELSKAKFDIYICEQELGDFVIVPPRSCHQVINSGGLTMKASWSRLIPRSLTLAMTLELPIYQRVCRPEIYRIKATIAATITNCISSLRVITGEDKTSEAAHHRSLLLSMLPLYRQMLAVEYGFSYHQKHSKKLSENDICDCCGADIWQSAMVCYVCQPTRDTRATSPWSKIVVCAPCYVDGRSCRCKTMQPAQVRPFNSLFSLPMEAREVLKDKDGNEHEIFSSKEWRFLVQISAKPSKLSLSSAFHPPYFRLANYLCDFRKAYSGINNGRLPERTCSLRHKMYVDHSIRCEGCHNMVCWGHALARSGIHFAAIVSQIIKDYQDNGKHGHLFPRKSAMTIPEFHSMHMSGGPPEWLGNDITTDRRWIEWLPQLALHFRPLRPLSDDIILGWYDVTPKTLDNVVKTEKNDDDIEYKYTGSLNDRKRKAIAPASNEEAVRRSKRPRQTLYSLDPGSFESSTDELDEESREKSTRRRQSTSTQDPSMKKARGRPSQLSDIGSDRSLHVAITDLTQELSQTRADLVQWRSLLEDKTSSSSRTEALLGQVVDLLKQLIAKSENKI